MISSLISVETSGANYDAGQSMKANSHTVRILSACLLVFFAHPNVAAAETHNRPVEAITVDSNGTYHAGYLSWVGDRSLFFMGGPAPELILLGHVSGLQEETAIDEVHGSRVVGHLQVHEVINCPASLQGQAKRIKTLECGAFFGLAIGDTVLVFLSRYEGSYAVRPISGMNRVLGMCLSCEDVPIRSSREFVDQIRKNFTTNVNSLSTEELMLWAEVDPWGIAMQFIMMRGPVRASD